jgi:recombination protein RecT
VPFNNRKTGRKEVQLIPGYRGLLDLARRSGEILSVDARVVREGDTFDYAFGLDPVLRHRPADNPERPITHVYAVIRLKGGGAQFDVLTHKEVEAVRAQSRASKDGPWVSHWPEMAKKTVLKRALKLAPMSVEAHTAVALDELAEAGVPQELDLVVDTHTGEVLEETPTATPLQQLTQTLPEPTPA